VGFYFQIICTARIPAAKHRHTIVFGVNGSFIINDDNKANTIAPTANPISRPGQTSPLNAKAQYLVK
jgi:hypothetical protein